MMAALRLARSVPFASLSSTQSGFISLNTSRLSTSAVDDEKKPSTSFAEIGSTHSDAQYTELENIVSDYKEVLRRLLSPSPDSSLSSTLQSFDDRILTRLHAFGLPELSRIITVRTLFPQQHGPSREWLQAFANRGHELGDEAASHASDAEESFDLGQLERLDTSQLLGLKNQASRLRSQAEQAGEPLDEFDNLLKELDWRIQLAQETTATFTHTPVSSIFGTRYVA